MTDRDDDRGGMVAVEDAEHASLLALLMKTLVERRLGDERLRDRVRGMEGDVEVRAGDMVVTMRFGGGGVAIVTGASSRPRARVIGTMPALLGIVTGGDLLGPLLDGFVKIRGNPFVLLSVLPLIRDTGGGGR